MIVLLSACLVFITIAYYVLQHRRFLTLALQIPSPTIIPYLGDLFLLIRHNFNPIKAFDIVNKTYGDCYAVWARQLLVFLSRPEDMEILMTNPATQDRGDIADGFAAIVGPISLMILDWEEAKHLKKAFHKNFTNSSQAIVFENFRKANRQLVQRLKLREGRWINFFDFMKDATTSAIVGSAVSENCENYPGFLNALNDIDKLMFLSTCRGISPLHRIDFLFNHFFGWKDMSPIIKGWENDMSHIISKKRHELAELKRKKEEAPNQYIYNLLQEERSVSNTNENIVSDITTLLATALDTTAITASYVLIMLALHPHYQQLVYEEDQIIQKELNGMDLDERSIAKYEFLSRVIKETLRIYPSSPLMPRRVNEDTKFGKYIVPKGATVLASILSMHRDPNIYEKPTVFDPDRFLPENVGKRPKYSYLPFSAGARACPGFRYGTQSTIFNVSAIIREFKVFTKYRSVQEIDDNLSTVVTLHDLGGFPLRFEKR